MRTAILACALAAWPLAAATHYLTISGLGGEKDYEQRFAAQANEVDKLLRGSGGDVNVVTLSGADSTRDKIKAAFEKIAATAKAEDAFVLLLIGHGSFDGAEYKLNIPGPDYSGTELAALCDKVPAGRQLVVNTTSASGGALEALQRAKRAVILATKAGSERNATVFARYWVEALRDPSADSDKNEVVSALEAYRFADRKTVEFYETNKRLATEHAVMEDTGAGEGVRAPSTANGQGLLAASFPLLRIGSAQRAAADPAKRQLLARKEQIEQRIDKLKYEKAAMALEDYRKQMSAALIELARLQEELDK
ncbi:MAG: hypothetical protein J0L64_03725 [Acidobacteria bacterium]|nr:hypothetical protein [Acidobacteriota bacterium]